MPPGGGPIEWEPYTEDAQFNADWWNASPFSMDPEDESSWWSLVQDGVEVARLELGQDVYCEQYLDLPDIGPDRLQIQLLEVAAPARRNGIGRGAMNLVAERFPDKRLMAFSEEADAFWERLGWLRCDHPDGPTHHRPLFIAPREWGGRRGIAQVV